MQRTYAIHELFTLQFQQPVGLADYRSELLEDMELELALLMHTYQDVSAVPTGLPPNHDHTIRVITGADLMKVRPYRYTQSQKEQIE